MRPKDRSISPASAKGASPRDKSTEFTTGERAHSLAETMLAVLRGSAKVKAVEIQSDSVSDIEPLDDNPGLTKLRIKP